MARVLTRYGNIDTAKVTTKPVKEAKVLVGEKAILEMLKHDNRTGEKAERTKKIRNLNDARCFNSSTREFLKQNRKANSRGKMWTVRKYKSIEPPVQTIGQIKRKPMVAGMPTQGRGIADLQKRRTKRVRKTK